MPVTKEMLQGLRENRARLMAEVVKIDAVLSLFTTVAAPVQKSHKAKSKATNGSERAKKAWATKKRKAAAAARANPVDSGAGASLLDVA